MALFFVLLAWFYGTVALKAQQSYSFSYQGVNRQYILYLPDDLPDQAPLVFALHGYGGNSSFMMNKSGMNEVADKGKFVVCYPQGTRDQNNVTHWNARLGISNANDVGFLKALAIYLQETHQLNPEQTFICGHSNGGFMSYTLACEASSVFKAIASMAGTMSGYTWTTRNIAKPIPILQIHGVDDAVVPIDGSIPYPGWRGAPEMDSVVEFWATVNSCTILDSVFLPNHTWAYTYLDGVDNNQVWYYKIHNWGHDWPTRSNASHTGTIASEVIWEFFELMGSESTGKDEKYVLRIKCYPNPVSDVLVIENPSGQDEKYTILDVGGRIVRTGYTIHETTYVNVSDLSAGLYYLICSEESFPVIKQKNHQR